MDGEDTPSDLESVLSDGEDTPSDLEGVLPDPEDMRPRDEAKLYRPKKPRSALQGFWPTSSEGFHARLPFGLPLPS